MATVWEKIWTETTVEPCNKKNCDKNHVDGGHQYRKVLYYNSGNLPRGGK